MANSVDPDEMSRYEPFYLDLYRLLRCLFWSVGLEGVNCVVLIDYSHYFNIVSKYDISN